MSAQFSLIEGIVLIAKYYLDQWVKEHLKKRMVICNETHSTEYGNIPCTIRKYADLRLRRTNRTTNRVNSEGNTTNH